LRPCNLTKSNDLGSERVIDSQSAEAGKICRHL
jgi:hypothetical protein